jgi:nickel-dependent lactate racemase
MIQNEIQTIISVFYADSANDIVKANETAVASLHKLALGFAKEMCDKQKSEIIGFGDDRDIYTGADIREASYPEELTE